MIILVMYLAGSQSTPVPVAQFETLDRCRTAAQLAYIHQEPRNVLGFSCFEIPYTYSRSLLP